MRRLDGDGATLLVLNESGGGAKTDEDAATRRTPEVMAILKVLATGQENSFSGYSSGALLISCSFLAMETIRWRLLIFDECDDGGEMFETDGDDNDGRRRRRCEDGRPRSSRCTMVRRVANQPYATTRPPTNQEVIAKLPVSAEVMTSRARPSI